jgi:hypothetical protein
MHGLFRVDTILGMIAGVYLVVTAAHALLIH